MQNQGANALGSNLINSKDEKRITELDKSKIAISQNTLQVSDIIRNSNTIGREAGFDDDINFGKSTAVDHSKENHSNGSLDIFDDDVPYHGGDNAPKDKKKLARMTARQNVKVCLIYPENKFKGYWDLFMTFILLITCMETPYIIAFIPDEPLSLKIFNYVIDGLFFLDIIAIFNSVYYDNDITVIDNHKQIAINYFKGQFAVDFFSILPIDIIL